MSIKIINPASSSTSSTSAQNLLINGAFDFWQRGTSSGSLAQNVPQYVPDRWYANNTTDGIVTMDQEPGELDGSLFHAIAEIQVGGTTGNIETWQVLDNLTTQQIYNKAASFSIYVKASGAVNQIGLQLAYATTEVQPTSFYGSETVVSVNSSTFTLCKIENQAIGISPTMAGVVGVRIRIAGVSSGNIYDALNGYSLEQAMLNMGATAQTFERAGMPSEELGMCQRFYQKSYDLTSNPGTVTFNGALVNDAQSANNPAFCGQLKVTMRVAPTVVYYNPGTGGTGSVRGIGTSSNVTINALASGQSNIAANTNAITLADAYAVHFTADAEI